MMNAQDSLEILGRRLERTSRLARAALALAALGWIAAIVVFFVARSIPSQSILLKKGAATVTLSPDELRFDAGDGDQAWLKMTPAPHLELVRGSPWVFLGVSDLNTHTPQLATPFGWLSVRASDGASAELQPTHR